MNEREKPPGKGAPIEAVAKWYLGAFRRGEVLDRPSVPFFWREWLEDGYVRLMTDSEYREYHLACLRCWGGPLTRNDLDSLPLSVRTHFIEIGEDLFMNKRMLKELRYLESERYRKDSGIPADIPRNSGGYPADIPSPYPSPSPDVDVGSNEPMSTSAPSGRQKLDRIDWSLIVQTWNTIAHPNALPCIRLPLSAKRQKKLRARLRETPDFWQRVNAEVEQRNQWAIDSGFPKFDQVIEREILDKLLDGNYRARATTVAEDRAIDEEFERFKAKEKADMTPEREARIKEINESFRRIAERRKG